MDSGAYGTIRGQWGRGQRRLWYYKGAGEGGGVLMVL